MLTACCSCIQVAVSAQQRPDRAAGRHLRALIRINVSRLEADPRLSTLYRNMTVYRLHAICTDGCMCDHVYIHIITEKHAFMWTFVFVCV